MFFGFFLNLYCEIFLKINIKFIVSGGVFFINDLEKLKVLGCDGVIVGKVIYEGKIILK